MSNIKPLTLQVSVEDGKIITKNVSTPPNQNSIDPSVGECGPLEEAPQAKSLVLVRHATSDWSYLRAYSSIEDAADDIITSINQALCRELSPGAKEEVMTKLVEDRDDYIAYGNTVNFEIEYDVEVYGK